MTIPDCDHVIDLGLCKQIEYNRKRHRVELVKCWISKASATQRAGRTGRTRPGNVYRLYPKDGFESGMKMYERGEMHRTTLDNVILELRDMCPLEAVDELLEETIEPPHMMSVDRALESLADQGLIKSCIPDADLTALGRFVGKLGVDLSIGRIVGLGVQLDVTAPAIMMAAGMSVQQPWRIASPLILKDPDDYNALMTSTLLSKVKFDAGLYSQPISLVRLLLKVSVSESQSDEPGSLLL